MTIFVRKTITMLFKMFGIDNAAQDTEQERRPRQLYVTKSRVLAQHTDKYFKKLMRSKEAFSHEGTSSNHFETPGESDCGDLLIFEEEDYRSDLPRKFSELEDRHFPLLLPFNKVRKDSEIFKSLPYCS